jgi:glycosyltransferase involved in cell wall biosynthesis
MWRGKTVAVIFPTYNEKDSIRAATLDYFSTGLADEVIVVNNNAAPGTSEELAGTGAREIFESKQGYGNALMRGIDECGADLIVLSEPDGTFSAHDLIKLLAYSDDVPVVFGTRTTREFIWAGANMGWFLRWGNFAVAKMTEFLFNTTMLTDMGCTLRLFRREALDWIRPRLTIGGSHFGPQLLLETVAHGIPFVEIPVNYRERVGESSVTGDFWKAFRLGMRMIALVLEYRFARSWKPRDRWSEGSSGERDLEALAQSITGTSHAGESRSRRAETQSLNQLRGNRAEQQDGEDTTVGIAGYQRDVGKR